MKNHFLVTAFILGHALLVSPAVYAQETTNDSANMEYEATEATATYVEDTSGDDLFPEVEVANATKPADPTAQVQFLVGQSVEANTAAVNDVYTLSNDATFNNTIDGDLFAAGNTIVINENATVSGSVRVTGNDITLNGLVNRNVLVMGNTVHIGSNALLMGNVSIFAKEVTIDGTIAGAARIEASEVNGSGDILADSSITAESIVLGNLSDPSLVHVQASDRYNRLNISNDHKRDMMWWIAKFFFSAAVGSILILLFPRSFQNGARVLNKRPFLVAWRGLVILCVTPVAALLLCFTLIGIPFALVGMLMYALMILIAHMWTGYWIGNKLLHDTHVHNERLNTILLFVVGLFMISAASQAPFIGMLVSIVAVIIGIGALTSRTE